MSDGLFDETDCATTYEAWGILACEEVQCGR